MTRLLAEIVDQLPITYRQVDHAIRKGWLTVDNPAPGHGGRRQVTDHQAQILTRYADLTSIGIPPDMAAPLAHRIELTARVIAALTDLHTREGSACDGCGQTFPCRTRRELDR